MSVPMLGQPFIGGTLEIVPRHVPSIHAHEMRTAGSELGRTGPEGRADAHLSFSNEIDRIHLEDGCDLQPLLFYFRDKSNRSPGPVRHFFENLSQRSLQVATRRQSPNTGIEGAWRTQRVEAPKAALCVFSDQAAIGRFKPTLQGLWHFPENEYVVEGKLIRQ